MTEDPARSAPAWLPATVGAAYRRGSSSDEDLISGAALGSMLETIARAGRILTSERAPRGQTDQAAGYRHILVLLALAIDEALRGSGSDPYEPHISPANVDAFLKWGMDCPDAAYSGSAVRGDAAYRVYGKRGSARYVGLQVMSGIAATTNVVLDELDLGPDGSFELVLSDKEQPGNWMSLSEDASTLVVRQFFYDWVAEEPARIQIERIDSARPPSQTASSLSAAGVARQMVAIGEFVESSLEFWLGIEEQGRTQGVNVFREPLNRTDIGGAAENVTVWGSWELDDDQALVIEVTPPDALYWSVSLGNYWWETIDYANHQSSLNGHQAIVDKDGVFRAVVAHEDPGVANWLDTAGNRKGPAIFRWLRADGAPVPETRVVSIRELEDVLPAETKKVGAEGRRAALAARRAGVRRRFCR